MRGTTRSAIKRPEATRCPGSQPEFEIIAPLTAAAFFTVAMLYWLAA